MVQIAIILLFVILVSYGATTTNATVASRANEAKTQYCNCQYNVPFEKEADCRSYGQLGDDVLIPWYRANQTCLDEYQIKIVAFDREILYEICPFENSTNVNIQLLLNEIRYNPSPATRAIQESYPIFWTESNTTKGLYELVDIIYDTRNNPDCTVSETLCWNSIREYFTINVDELGKSCKELHARNRFDMDLEQSTIRIRLCQEVDTTSSTELALCEPLVSQINEIKGMNPSKACSAFGLGPGTQEVPTTNCSNTIVANTESTSSSCMQQPWKSYYVAQYLSLILLVTTSHLFY
jgi:hypothetical protein